MKKLYLAVYVGLAFCAWAGLSLYGISEQEKRHKEFPQPLSHRFVLDDANKNIESHIVYHKDETTKVYAVIQFKNGVTRYNYYHERTQKITKVEDYYSPKKGDKPRLVTESHMSQDGTKLIRHKVYRMDGSLYCRGSRQLDGKYKTVYYDTDGKTIRRERLFDKKEVIVSEHSYYADGTTELKTEWTNGYLTSSYFRKDGTAKSVIENHYAVQRGVFFNQDGKTVKAVFADSAHGTEINYMSADGRPEFIVLQTQGRVLVSYKDKDIIYFDQFYRPKKEKGTTNYCAEDNSLTAVKEYDSTVRNPYLKTQLRTFLFAKGSDHPTEMTVFSRKGPDTIYALDENGVVTKVRHANPHEKRYSYEVGDKVDYDPVMFKRNKFECLAIPEKVNIPQTRTFTY